MINSGPVLYLIYLIFLEKKVFIVIQIYLLLVVLGGRTMGSVHPDTLATKWDFICDYYSGEEKYLNLLMFLLI